MTPTQAYELARMYAARIGVLSERKDKAASEIAQPQEGGPKGESRLRNLQHEHDCLESSLSELRRTESQVRRVLGLVQGESDA